MHPDSQLSALLQQHLPFHKARIKFMAMFVLALIKTSTVNFAKLAIALNSKSRIESNYRRIQRFFAQVDLDVALSAGLFMRCYPNEPNWSLLSTAPNGSPVTAGLIF